MNILDPQGPVAAAEKTILIDSVAIMLAIVVPTIIAVFAFAYWYRASNTRARYRPDWAYSGRIELVVWSIPALTIILLGGVAWIGAHQLDPASPVAGTGSPVRVQVVSLDWKWLFIYPDQGIATVNDLTVPAGATLQRVGEFLPLGIVFQQFGAFRDGLKHVVQIMDQTFQSEICDCHSDLLCDSL